ncbi:DUF4365 domain-containing protein [Caballeronia sordidicola]|uniref:DUF4365 domain-containing protein n=1 Tax=Caballeronia sordidicola TaxID=196367 RepID=UPI00094DA293|nr:DUF4365 domain-containing protein [Caballeronia sordidicola]
MKYPLGTANGDAGEFFAAYKIAKELGWPCRLFDIDIGIDAQVEILTKSRESTGRFVALQVKASSAKEVDCRYVSARQMKYWRSLDIPVFVVLVDLQIEQMFLHLVEETREYERTPKGMYKIRFDLVADIFTPAYAMIMAEASERLAMSHINQYLVRVEDAIETILQKVQDVADGNPDPDDLIACMESRTGLFGLLNQADAASALSRVGKNLIMECRKHLSWALNDLQGTMAPMELDYSDKGDISGFLREDYPHRPE